MTNPKSLGTVHYEDVEPEPADDSSRISDGTLSVAVELGLTGGELAPWVLPAVTGTIKKALAV